MLNTRFKHLNYIRITEKIRNKKNMFKNYGKPMASLQRKEGLRSMLIDIFLKKKNQEN